MGMFLRFFVPALFGFICGTVVGFFLVYVLDIKAPMSQAIGGAIVGLVFGGVIGSISGEINATGESGANRVVVAGFFGIIGGMLGATKFLWLWMLFHRFHWPIPEWAPPLSYFISLF